MDTGPPAYLQHWRCRDAVKPLMHSRSATQAPCASKKTGMNKMALSPWHEEKLKQSRNERMLVLGVEAADLKWPEEPMKGWDH